MDKHWYNNKNTQRLLYGTSSELTEIIIDKQVADVRNGNITQRNDILHAGVESLWQKKIMQL